jgi:glycosyltransferase involved in cell wall biosynthesis
MTEPRKVLEVLGMSTGGIAAHVADIAEGLEAQQNLAIDIAGPPDLPMTMPKPVLPLSIPAGPTRHRRAVAELRKIILNGGYQVVHAHGLRAAIDSARAARNTPAVTVATIHNLVLPEISGRFGAVLYRRAEPLAVRWNDLVFAPSRDIARHLRAATPSQASKVEVLHLGVPAPPPPQSRKEARAALRISPTQQLLVTVARLAPQKALHILLQAMTLLPDNVRLAIVGSGPLEAELKGFVQSSDLAGRVAFLGHRIAPQNEVSAADVFCLTSVWEACSLAAQEAILLGVPVVSTNVGGMPELIEDGVSGRLVPPGDPGAFASAVQELLALPPEDRRRLVANALKHLREHFSRADMLERIAAAYLEERRAIA